MSISYKLMKNYLLHMAQPILFAVAIIATAMAADDKDSYGGQPSGHSLGQTVSQQTSPADLRTECYNNYITHCPEYHLKALNDFQDRCFNKDYINPSCRIRDLEDFLAWRVAIKNFEKVSNTCPLPEESQWPIRGFVKKYNVFLLQDVKAYIEQLIEDCVKEQSAKLSSLPKSGIEQPVQSNALELFGSSFLNGANYTLIPEVIRDTVEGYSPRFSHIAATIIQGGIVFYNTSSYVPTITGMAVRCSSSYLGFSDRASTTAGSVAAVIMSVSQSLTFSQGTAIDTLIDCGIAMTASCAGSILVLKVPQAMSWVNNRLWRPDESRN